MKTRKTKISHREHRDFLATNWHELTRILVFVLGLMVCSVQVSQASPMETAFTYQGRLIDSNSAADGLYDFQFKLFDANTVGAQQGSTIDVNEVDVIDGYFTVALDFGGGVFDGNDRWLDIGVRPGALSDPNVYTVLTPRQEVTPAPYAVYAQSSGGLDTSGDLVLTSGSGNVDVGSSADPTILHIFGNWRTYNATGAKGIYPTEFTGASYSDPSAGGNLFTTSGPLTLEAGDANVTIGTASNPTNLNTFGIFKVFSASNSKGIYPTEFTGASYGTPSELEWDFGDGGTNTTTMTPTHTYKSPINFLPSSRQVNIGLPNKPSELHSFAAVYVYGADANGAQPPSSGYPEKFIKTASYPDYGLITTGTDQDLLLDPGSGKVGIGTTSPSTKLDVTGSVKAGDLILGSAVENNYDYVDYNDVGMSQINTHGVFSFHADRPLGETATSPSAAISVDGIYSSGNVGIGTTSPEFELDVQGEMRLGNKATRHLLFENSDIFSYDGLNPTTLELQSIWSATASYADTIINRYGGNVGIKTGNPAYNLDVNGDIRAIGSVYYGGTEGNADGTAYTKPDYVFEEGYDVMSIEQVEEYLKTEKHLPWITSAGQEKEENGDVIDMTRMAFETVETAENLQVQIIELNKVIKEQAALIKEQQKRIAALEETAAQNQSLKQRLEALEGAIQQHQLASAKEVQQ